MALRLLPFRDYSEHEVLNLFAMDTTLTAGQANSAVNLEAGSADQSTYADAGVFVKVKNGTLNTASSDFDPIDADSTTHANFLGKTDYPHVGANYYPVNPLTLEATTATTDNCVGLTLRQTAIKDENGEKLNYYPEKKDELYAVLPGETVPVLKRGMVTLTDAAVVGDLRPGSRLILGGGTNAGKASGIASWLDVTAGSTTGVDLSQADVTRVGTVLASGYRDDAAAFAGTGAGTYTTSHVYGGVAFHKGNYVVVDLNVNG